MRVVTSLEQKDNIVKLHSQGLTNRRIAVQVGVHQSKRTAPPRRQ
jgi:IS30 family transposase